MLNNQTNCRKLGSILEKKETFTQHENISTSFPITRSSALSQIGLLLQFSDKNEEIQKIDIFHKMVFDKNFILKGKYFMESNRNRPMMIGFCHHHLD